MLVELLPFVKDEDRDVEDYLEQNGYPDLPPPEECWQVPAPINWPPKPPTPPPLYIPPALQTEIPSVGE